MKIAKMHVQLIDSMGTDLSVVNAARVSMAKESEWEGEEEILDHDGDVMQPSTLRLSAADEKLVCYLATHKHWTPFAHCFASFRIKAPVFVARQLAKHQVGLAWNEVSRRYVDEEPEFWFPTALRERPDGSIKQGSGGVHKNSGPWLEAMDGTVNCALKLYSMLVQQGIAPEQARMILPLNTMTEWVWSGSLAAWGRVCSLRLDSHAQVETTEVARSIAGYMASLFPVSWKALT